nr:MAG TPA: hypothetical protein [Crassvirales sp.]
MKYYLRFGDIPVSGLSNIWLRDEIIGQELGVSDPQILSEITEDFWKKK